MTHLHQRRHLGATMQLKSGYVELITPAMCLLLLLFCGCAKHEASRAAAPEPSPAAPSAPKIDQTPSPTLAEVNEAVTRIFKDAAIIDSKHQPNFLAGDFNGDASQDIAVIVQPANGKLAEMNQELPPWILKDPLANPDRPAPPPRIAANDLLLAIIHGYGPNGWRDAQATQTYVLKNAVGSEVKAYTKSDFAISNQGKKTPRLFGDLIAENLAGKSGFLYFNGAQYSWYDPKTFKGEPETRLTHPGMTVKKKVDLLHPNLVAAEK
jgi:hypothetical protein